MANNSKSNGGIKIFVRHVSGGQEQAAHRDLKPFKHPYYDKEIQKPGTLIPGFFRPLLCMLSTSAFAIFSDSERNVMLLGKGNAPLFFFFRKNIHDGPADIPDDFPASFGELQHIFKTIV